MTRAEALCQQGHEFAAARRFQEALECFETALTLDRSNDEVRTVIKRLQSTVENMRNAAQLAAGARAQKERGQFEKALEKAVRAVDLDAGNREALQLRDEIQELMRTGREAALLARAESLCAGAEYDAALAVLSEATPDLLTSPNVAAFWVRVERERAEAGRHRQARYQAALAKAREALSAGHPREEQDSTEAVRTRLEQARRLLAEGQPGAAVELLEFTNLRYPGAPDVVVLLSSARDALAAFRAREFVARSLAQIPALEATGQFNAANALLEAALGRNPDSPELIEAAERIRRKLQEQEREGLLAEHTRRIEEAIAAKDWNTAARHGDAARQDFPGEPSLALYSARIEEARRQAGIQVLQDQVRVALARMDLPAAERYLTATQATLAQDPVWRALWREFEQRRAYDRNLRRAGEERAAGRHNRAEEILRALLSAAPDQRAAGILESVARERLAAEKEARRQAEAAIAAGRAESDALVQKGDYTEAIAVLERLAGRYPDQASIRERVQQLGEAAKLRAAEEEARRQAEAAIAQGLAEADTFVQKGDHRGAIATLERLAGQNQDRIEIQRRIQQVQEAARQEQERQRREAEEEARRQAEAAIVKGLGDADALVQKGDHRGAIASLERLAGQNQDRLDIQRRIQQVREAARQEQERQRREAEEEARRQAEAAIAKGLGEAEALVRKGDYQGAVAILDQLDRQHPDRAEILEEMHMATSALERQREQAAIAKGRREAAALAQKEEYQEALAILDRLAGKYPGDVGVQEDRKTARAARARQVNEAEDRVRRQRAQEALAKGRDDAAALGAKGLYGDAMAILAHVLQDFENQPGIESDVQSAARDLEQLRRQNEEQARRRREEAAITKGRQDAANLIENGDCQGAIRVLDWLAVQYPGHAGIQRDREAAQREQERLRWEAEEQARRQREQAAVAQARGDAASLMRDGDCEGALALLDKLAEQYPGYAEIRRDRDAARRELERRRVEAQEQERRQRDEVAIAKSRQDVAEQVQRGDYQGALAILDWLAGQFPGHPGVKQDQDALRRQLEALRQKAEDEARRQRDLLEIANGRQDANRLIRSGNYQAALAVLDRLAVQYPADTEIARDRAAAADEWNRRQHEVEDRARLALAKYSERQRSQAEQPGAAPPTVVERVPVEELRASEERAQQALAAFWAKKQEQRRPQMPADSSTVARIASWSRQLGDAARQGPDVLAERWAVVRSAGAGFAVLVAAKGRVLARRVLRKED
jgi:tetratricopeptide (TPR) repeat protein